MSSVIHPMPPKQQATPKPGELWEPSGYNKKYLTLQGKAIKPVLVLEVNNTPRTALNIVLNTPPEFVIFLTADCKKLKLYLSSFIHDYIPCKDSITK